MIVEGASLWILALGRVNAERRKRERNGVEERAGGTAGAGRELGEGEVGEGGGGWGWGGWGWGEEMWCDEGAGDWREREHRGGRLERVKEGRRAVGG